MMLMPIDFQVIIPNMLSSKRLDLVLSELLPEHSRERIKSWVLAGNCLVDGMVKRPKDKVFGGEKVVIKAEFLEKTVWQAEKTVLPLNIVYEDQDLLLINKTANCVVHPGNGNNSGTLVNALLEYAPELKHLPRAGIVHRLDKDTTGLMVVAKSLVAHTSLVEQLAQRTVQRGYEAIVHGLMVAGGKITEPIARSKGNRLKMAIAENGKPAITNYRVLTKFKAHTHIAVQLETGRTHQIRVHMEYLRHSIVGDRVYGGIKLAKGMSLEVNEAVRNFSRQALHAKKLGLIHPVNKQCMSWEVPLPEDMQHLLKLLKNG